MMNYLQIGNAGGTSLLSFGVIVLVIAAVLTYWVYNDATGRGRDKPLLWALGVGILTLLTLIGGLIAFGVYLYTRD
ncbi:MAG: hypothetical protein U5J98_01540 [Halobacteriales archaeon]|nr:hypothetical protein [Halobacteriales archaeon]